jgi:N-acetylglucosaminyl-diphospho-decaprenol L-rhamnosyltransferase
LFGAANNLAAKEAQGKYLLFLNSDTIISSNIFPEVLNYLNKNEEVASLSPKLLLAEGSLQEHIYGSFPSIWDKLKKQKVSNDVSRVDWLSGAALFMRHDVFKEIGGFDERFFMYFEDIDLAKRIKDLNLYSIYYPGVSITHLGGKSINKDKIRKKYYYTSQDYYYKKHHSYFTFLLMKLMRSIYLLYK